MQNRTESQIPSVFNTNGEYFRVIREFHRNRDSAAIDAEEQVLIDRFIGSRCSMQGAGRDRSLDGSPTNTRRV